MNILYICPKLPYPPFRGDKLVIYNQLKFLSKRHKVTLLTMIEKGEELEVLSGSPPFYSRILTFKKRPNFSLSNFIMLCCKKYPFNVIRYYSPEMFKCSKNLIESAEFDIVHVAFYFMTHYAVSKHIKVPKRTGLILDTHNIEYLVYSKYALLTKNPFLKLFMKLESEKLKWYELSSYKKFDKCIVFSALDRDNILKLTKASNIVINPAPIEIIDRQRNDFLPASNEEENVILYFGNFRYIANDDAIRFFCENIFPIVKTRLPNVKFIIAGQFPSKYVLALGKDPNIKITGFVQNMKDLLKKASLVIVPLRIGGGTRIKILEAWTAGKAVVSTSIGAEGVDVTEGEDIVIADSAEDFANAVVSLLNDKARRDAIGQAAFRKVCERYNPEKIIDNLEEIYKDILENKH